MLAVYLTNGNIDYWPQCDFSDFQEFVGNVERCWWRRGFKWRTKWYRKKNIDSLQLLPDEQKGA